MIEDPQKLTQDLLSLIPNVVRQKPRVPASRTHCLVSTALCLYDPTWPKSSTDDPKTSSGPRGNTCTEEKEISLKKLLSNEGREEEEKYGVSTELTLFIVPWTIKKKLTISDRSRLNRLLLNAGPVESHLLSYLSECYQKMVQEGQGLTVEVYDRDTESTHQVLLNRPTKRGSYVVSGGWFVDFVTRRVLKHRDEIGMYWDRFDSKLHFSVLSRAPGSVLADPSHAPVRVVSGSIQEAIAVSPGSE